MIKSIGAALFCMTMAVACGGGEDSGVDPDTLIVDLLPEESDAVCEGALSVVVNEREVDCGDGIVVDVTQPDAEDIADCADNLDSIGSDFPDCDVTVGEFEACQDDISLANDDEICALVVEGDVPASCEFLLDPACSGE